MTRRRSEQGYILLEAAVALVLLTAGVYAIHGTIQQALITRGQAQDYTQVRFLLEKIIADLEMQAQITEHSDAGTFPSPHERFRWQYTVRKADIPLPPPPVQNEFQFQYPMRWLAHVHATVSWERGGQPFSESMETLFDTEKLWVPYTPPAQ